MVFSLEDIKTAYKTAYSEMPKNYIKAKIYHGGKNYDLTKRWYVYYSFIDSETNTMKRQTPITLGVNRSYKTRKERMHHLRIIRDIVNDFLAKGHSPGKIKTFSQSYSAESCLDYALSIKKTEVKHTTYIDYDNRIRLFKKFLKGKGYLHTSIKEVSKRQVSEFLNQFQVAKTRNNVKVAISSVFSVLADEDYIERNFIKEIRNKKVVQKPTKIYTDKQVNDIVKLLNEQNKTLLMFIYFESYMFWRPLEIVRIRKSNIDFEKKVISVETKTKISKTKIIPDIIFEDLKKFVKTRKDIIFEPSQSNWNEVEDVNKRDYYTRLFAQFRKKNNIDKDLKLYSFRHTFITKCYLELRKKLSKEDAIKQLSLITGHESKAIYNYIQVNDVELPKDFSELLTFNN